MMCRPELAPKVIKTWVLVDPPANSMSSLERMSSAQIQARQMTGSTPPRANRVTWFLEGMIAHHGAALVMAHDALKKSSNPTIQRLARQIIVAQRREIAVATEACFQRAAHRPSLPLIVTQFDRDINSITTLAGHFLAIAPRQVIWIGKRNDTGQAVVW